MLSDYATYLRFSLRTHSASLSQAFEIEYKAALPDVERRSIARIWWDYQGPDTAPFVVYIRWQPHRVTIANIAGDSISKGRLPIICEALEEHAHRHSLTCRFEAIGNEHLTRTLANLGYTPVPGTDIHPDMIKTPH